MARLVRTLEIPGARIHEPTRIAHSGGIPLAKTRQSNSVLGKVCVHVWVVGCRYRYLGHCSSQSITTSRQGKPQIRQKKSVTEVSSTIMPVVGFRWW